MASHSRTFHSLTIDILLLFFVNINFVVIMIQKRRCQGQALYSTLQQKEAIPNFWVGNLKNESPPCQKHTKHSCEVVGSLSDISFLISCFRNPYNPIKNRLIFSTQSFLSMWPQKVNSRICLWKSFVFFSQKNPTQYTLSFMSFNDIIENASSLLFCLDSTYFTWVYK